MHRVHLLSATFVLAVVHAAAGELVRGTVCVSDAPCRQIRCGDAVASAMQPRTYTFASEAPHRFVFGRLETGVARISCETSSRVEFHLDARALGRKDSARLKITTSGKQDVWQWQLARRELEEPIVVLGPAGEYDVTFESAGYTSIRRHIALTSAKLRIDLKFESRPVLSGRVIDRERSTPIAGALVLGDGTDARAVTTDTGHFSLSIDPADWPKTLKVIAGGYSELLQPAPAARSTATIGDLAVSRGGTITVELQQSKGAEVIALELSRTANHGRTPGPVVRRLHLDKGAAARTAEFENVEPGEYIVVACGEQPGEKFGEPVRVAASQESRVALSIAPFRLRIRARSQGKELPNARVEIRSRDAFWHDQVITDDSGDAAITLWQGGRFNARVVSAGSTPWLERRTIDANVDTEWDLDVPALEITGVVIDSVTGKPVPHAGVSLTMHSTEGYQLAVQTEAETDGTFRFAPVTHGEHTLKAAARGYPVSEMTYTFLEPQTAEKFTLKLDPVTPVRVTVTDARSVPISGAHVIQFVGLSRVGMGITAADGTVDVLVPPGELRDLFVVPRDGSLAFARLQSEGPKDVTIAVPDGSSRVVVRALSDKGAPISDMTVVLRYNSIVLPYEVLAALTGRQGTQAASNAQGQIVFDHMPPGVYEMWPAGSVAELRDIASGIGPSAPIRLAAAPGENVAELRFQPAGNP